MTYKSYEKALDQLKNKPQKVNKFIKHNSPKKREYGKAKLKCRRCGRIGAHISKYGLHLCRQCFRETALNLGFKKFN